MCQNMQMTDEKNRRKQIIRDLSHNYFIEAGAGAGKTSLIISRIVNQLSSGITPDRIVAITFTNKAAEELRFRIIREVKEAEKTDPKLKDILPHIGEMQISTIHSFCHRILSEHCFAAGLQPDFVLLADAEAQKEPTAFFRERFDKQLQSWNNNGNSSAPEYSYRDYLDNFLDICDLPDDVTINHDKGIEAYEQKTQDLNQCQAQYAALLADTVALFVKSVAEKRGIPAFLAGAPYLYADFNTEEKIQKNIIKKENNPIFKSTRANPISPQDSTDVWNACAAKLQELRNLEGDIDQLKHFLKNREKDYKSALKNRDILNFIRPVWQAYAKKPQHRKLSNDKLLQRTLQLLHGHPEVIQKLQSQFDCIYVDEFQDTDPVQKELVYSLGRDSNGQFLPGKLFVVGDPKQSIYRFRNADYRLFYSVKKDFRAAPQACICHELSVNHRSNKDLIEYFNTMGPLVFPQGGSVQYLPMLPYKPERDNTVLHGAYRIPEDADGWDEKKDCAAVIRIIQSLVGKESVFDEDGKKARPIRYSDFLVIPKNAAGMNAYVSAFHAAGIPVNVSVQYTPGDAAELRRFWLLFRAVALPGYRRAAAGWQETAYNDTAAELNYAALKDWRSRFRGRSAASILGELTENYEWYLYANSTIPAHRATRIQTALRQMTETVLSAAPDNALAISDAMQQYVDGTIDYQLVPGKNVNCVRFFNQHKAKGLEGNIVIICQRKKSPKGNTYTENEGKTRYQSVTTGAFRNKYTAYALDTTVRSKAEAEDEAEVARLAYVSVTRAKEALIFLPPIDDPDAFETYASSALVTEKFFGEELCDADTPTDVATSAYSADADVPGGRTSAAEEAEDSGTDVTACPAPHTPQCGIFEANIYPISPSLLEVHRPHLIARKQTTAGTSPAPELAAPVGANAPATKPDEVSDAQGPLSYESDDPNDATEALSDESDELSGGRPKGNVFGTVMHRVFELTVKELHAGAQPYTDTVIRRALLESNEDIEAMFPDPAAARNVFAAYLRKILPSFRDFFRVELADTEALYTEYPFQISVSGAEADALLRQFDLSSETVAKQLPSPAGEATPLLSISGKADLVLRKKGGALIIWDYKSDARHSDESENEFKENIRSTYRNQMTLYRWVFARLFSSLNVAGKFYSCEIGEVD